MIAARMTPPEIIRVEAGMPGDEGEDGFDVVTARLRVFEWAREPPVAVTFTA